MLKLSILLPLLYSLSFGSTIDDEVQQLIKKTKENMVFVKGGSFMMGDPLFIDNESGAYGEERQIIGSPENKKKHPDARWEPTTFGYSGEGQHKVTLSDFSIQKYMVTWKDFDTYSKFKNNPLLSKKWMGRRDWRKPDHAVKVHWQEAKDYCQWLGKQTDENFDLPTEAQWEYAARSRGEYVFWATNDGSGNNGGSKTFGEVQNIAYHENQVGTMLPNPLGLYDMSSGFRYEWVNDWYDENYYKSSPESNPKGPQNGTERVLRNSSDEMSTVAYGRFHRKSKGKYRIPSFRCIINP